MSAVFGRGIGELSGRGDLGVSLTFEFEGRNYLRMEDIGVRTAGERDVDLYYEIEGDRFFGDVMDGDVWRDLTEDEVRAYVAEWGLREAVGRVCGAGDIRKPYPSASRRTVKRESLGERIERVAEGSRRRAADKDARQGAELSERSRGASPLR